MAVSSTGIRARADENLIELARQPSDRGSSAWPSAADHAGRSVAEMSVDFSRGQILRAVVQSKSPIERVQEDGGPVGYVIIGVGMLGLLLCLWKAFVLYSTGAKISSQLKSQDAEQGQPAGPRNVHLYRRAGYRYRNPGAETG